MKNMAVAEPRISLPFRRSVAIDLDLEGLTLSTPYLSRARIVVWLLRSGDLPLQAVCLPRSLNCLHVFLHHSIERVFNVGW